jgi:hypothetical protein
MTNLKTRAWVVEARAAIGKLSQKTGSEREAELKRLAAPRSSQTLQREIVAVEFLDKLNQLKLPSGVELEAFPVKAIEHLLRWYNRDPEASLQAAGKLISGWYTTKTLGEAERDSRTRPFEGAGKALEANYRRKIEKEIEVIANRFGKLTRIKEDLLPSFTDQIRRAIDFAVLDGNGNPLVAFIIAGPYTDKKLYIRRAFDWVAKASALLKVCNLVYLILPENGDEKPFLLLQQQLQIDAKRLRIRTISLTNSRTSDHYN